MKRTEDSMNDRDLITVLRRLILEGGDRNSELEDDECDKALRSLLGNARSPKKDKRVYAAYWAKTEFKWPTPDEFETVPLDTVDPCGVEQVKDSRSDTKAATVGHIEKAESTQQSSSTDRAT
jgi:hypothetical protein